MITSLAPSVGNFSRLQSFLNAHIDFAKNASRSIFDLIQKNHVLIVGLNSQPKEISAAITLLNHLYVMLFRIQKLFPILWKSLKSFRFKNLKSLN